MRLENKKALIARSLDVGKNRIILNRERLEEIKQAITKQDMRDLRVSGAINIKEIKGKKKKVKRKTRRRQGSIRKKVNKRKKEYMAFTRKFRAHIGNLKKRNEISNEDYREIRKEIRDSIFKSKAHLKERIDLLGSDVKFRTQGPKKAKKKKGGRKK